LPIKCLRAEVKPLLSFVIIDNTQRERLSFLGFAKLIAIWMASFVGSLPSTSIGKHHLSPPVRLEAAVGSVVNRAERDRLNTFCEFAKPISICNGEPFCLCSLDSGVCFSNGKRERFSFHLDGFLVIWICNKLDGVTV